MILCGRILTALNSQRDRPRTLAGTSEVRLEVLSKLQSQLVQFYAGLPESMKWSVDNFKHQEQRGHGVRNAFIGYEELTYRNRLGNVSYSTPMDKRCNGARVPTRADHAPF